MLDLPTVLWCPGVELLSPGVEIGEEDGGGVLYAIEMGRQSNIDLRVTCVFCFSPSLSIIVTASLVLEKQTVCCVYDCLNA